MKVIKKHPILLLVALFFSFGGFTQEYTPYNFINFETEWTHHAFNEDLLDKEINAYFLEDVAITDSAIYAVYAIPSVIWNFNGFLLEKLDAETGALLWDYTYFQKSNKKRDTPCQISIKDDNTLILSTFRELDEDEEVSSSWYVSQMNNWVFDTNTGELLDTLTTINGDPDHVFMVMDFNPILDHLLQSVVNEQNDSYQYLLSTRDYTNIKILDYQLNELGHPITTDSVFLPLKYSSVDRSFTTRLGENKIFNFRKSFDPNHPQDSFNIEITHLDSNLNIIHSKNISNDFFGEYHYLDQVNESRFTVIHFGEHIFEDQPYRYMTLYAYDLAGNLLEEVVLEREDGSPLYSTRGFNILPIAELNQTLLVSFNKTETEAYWEWFLTSPNGSVEQIGKTILDNIHDRFVFASFNPTYMEYLGDGEILLYALHESVEGSNNITETGIPSLSIVSLDKLRTTVAVENIANNNELIVYPNPAYSEINIKESPNIYKKYEIVDVEGKVIQSGGISTDMINIENISNGFYILQLYDKNDKIYIQTIIKQKR